MHKCRGFLAFGLKSFCKNDWLEQTFDLCKSLKNDSNSNKKELHLNAQLRLRPATTYMGPLRKVIGYCRSVCYQLLHHLLPSLPLNLTLRKVPIQSDQISQPSFHTYLFSGLPSTRKSWPR